MRKKTLIYLLLILSSHLYSQFREGYIITHDNDTIHGNIAYEGAILNSQICRFKLDNNSEIKIYNPKDINSYRFINGKYFVTRKIKIVDKEDFVFLNLLIKGDVSIYSYFGKRYFLTFNNDSLIELKVKKDTIIKENRIFIVDKNEYIGVLSYYLKDAGIQSDINNMNLSSNSLVRLIKEYHKKTNKDYYVYEDKNLNSKLIFNFGLTTSLVNSNLFIWDGYSPKVNDCYSYGLGLKFNITNFPYIFSNFILQFGIDYYSILYRYNGNFGSPFPYEVNDGGRLFDISLLRITGEVEYKIPIRYIQPIIGIGFVDNLTLKRTYYNEIYKQSTDIRTQFSGFLTTIGAIVKLNEKSSLLLSKTSESEPDIFKGSYPSQPGGIVRTGVYQLSYFYKIK